MVGVRQSGGAGQKERDAGASASLSLLYLSVSVSTSALGNERHLDKAIGKGPKVVGIEIGILLRIPQQSATPNPLPKSPIDPLLHHP